MFETSLDLNIHKIFDSIQQRFGFFKSWQEDPKKVFIKRVVNIEKKNVVNVQLGPESGTSC